MLCRLLVAFISLVPPAASARTLACETTTICTGTQTCNFVSAPAFQVVLNQSRSAAGIALERIRLGLPLIESRATLGTERLTYASDRAELILTFAEGARAASAALLIGESRYIADCAAIEG